MPQMQPQQQQHMGPLMPYTAAAEIPQLQAKIEETLMLLQGPLPPPLRTQLQMQLGPLNVRLQQAQIMVMYNSSVGVPGPMAGMHPMGMGVGMNQPMMGGVGMGVGMGGGMQGGMQMSGGPSMMGHGSSMEDQTFKPGEYRPGWTNPFPNQQPAGGESAYQRLPVNNRRKGPKRDRPSDFLEVAGDGQAKAARYWE